jgi:hypothetical protein
MKRSCFALPSILCLLLTSSAFGGEPENQAAVALAKLLVTPAAYQAMVEQMSIQMSAGLSKPEGKPLPDLTKKATPVLLEAMPYNDIINWTAESYASRFTLAELDELAKFYRTPVGIKMNKLLSEITGETGKTVGTRLSQRLPILLTKHGLSSARLNKPAK